MITRAGGGVVDVDVGAGIGVVASTSSPLSVVVVAVALHWALKALRASVTHADMWGGMGLEMGRGWGMQYERQWLRFSFY